MMHRPLLALAALFLLPTSAYAETSIEYRIGDVNYEIFVSDPVPAGGDQLEANVSVSLSSSENMFEVAGIATAASEGALIASALLGVGVITGDIELDPGETITVGGLSFTTTDVVLDETAVITPSTGYGLILPLVSVAKIALLGSLSDDSLENTFREIEAETGVQTCSNGNLNLSVEKVIDENFILRRRVTVTDSNGQPIQGGHVTGIFPRYPADQDILHTNRTNEFGYADFFGSAFPESTQFYFVATKDNDEGGMICKLEEPSSP